MNKENKKDAFLNAIAGTTPLKKSNRFYEPIVTNKTTKEEKRNESSKNNLPVSKNKDQKSEVHAEHKLEQPRINKKLKKGAINIDKKIDFHGFTVEEAKIKFFETVDSCFSTKKRCILFVTGKGLIPPQNPFGEKKLYYGKIRNEFLNWTSNKTISKKILSVEQAGMSYGGDGAFFVYLRKNVKSW